MKLYTRCSICDEHLLWNSLFHTWRNKVSILGFCQHYNKKKIPASSIDLSFKNMFCIIKVDKKRFKSIEAMFLSENCLIFRLGTWNIPWCYPGQLLPYVYPRTVAPWILMAEPLWSLSQTCLSCHSSATLIIVAFPYEV